MHWFPGYCLARDQSAAVAYMMNTAVVWLLLVQFFLENSGKVNKLE